MAIVSRIAPITGRFKRRVMFDVTASVVVGFGLANLWWYGVVAPKFEKFTAFDKQNRELTIAEEKEWMQGNNYKREDGSF